MVELLCRGQRVSNHRFKDTTGWEPAVPDANAGLARQAGGPPTG